MVGKRTHSAATETVREQQIAAAGERGASAVTPALAESLQAARPTVPDDVAESIRAALGIDIIDPETGERRVANLDDEGDQQLLLEQNQVRVLSTTAGGEKGQNTDPRTGFVAMRPSDYPPGFLSGNILPINPMMLGAGVMAVQDELREVFLFMPLIPMPVRTPPLYLMITGSEEWCTQSSFHILQFYAAALRLISTSETVRTRRHTACEWLKECVAQGEVSAVDLQAFVEAVEFKDGVAHAPQDMLNVVLAPDIVETFCGCVEAVKKVDHEPWRFPPEVVFAEDVLEDKAQWGEVMSEGISHSMDEAVATQMSRGDTVEMLYAFTFTALHHYEITILRLMTEASLTPVMEGTFPMDFVSPTQPPQPHELHELLVGPLSEALEAITQARGVFITGQQDDAQCDVPDTFAPQEQEQVQVQVEDAEGTSALPDAEPVRSACLPSREQLYAFYRFLQFRNPGQEAMEQIAHNLATHVQMSMVHGPATEALEAMRQNLAQLDAAAAQNAETELAQQVLVPDEAPELV